LFSRSITDIVTNLWFCCCCCCCWWRYYRIQLWTAFNPCCWRMCLVGSCNCRTFQCRLTRRQSYSRCFPWHRCPPGMSSCRISRSRRPRWSCTKNCTRHVRFGLISYDVCMISCATNLLMKKIHVPDDQLTTTKKIPDDF